MKQIYKYFKHMKFADLIMTLSVIIFLVGVKIVSTLYKILIAFCKSLSEQLKEKPLTHKN